MFCQILNQLRIPKLLLLFLTQLCTLKKERNQQRNKEVRICDKNNWPLKILYFNDITLIKYFYIIKVARLITYLQNKMIPQNPQIFEQSHQKAYPFRFPILNLYANPRIHNQKINNSRIPLMVYKQLISANNCSQENYSNSVNIENLRKIRLKDGLIFHLKDMKRQSQIASNLDVNQSMSRYNQIIRNQQITIVSRMKILICVCMYNETKDALELTLNGIYKNLKPLSKQGIHPGDIAVVLIQDGILKLVKDRVKRTFVGGENSLVNFYEELDRIQGKPYCYLKQRIHTILNQIDNYERKGMLSSVQRNNNFPPSIQKNVSLVYQNLWYPEKSKLGAQNAPLPKDQLRIFSCFKHTNGTKLSSHLWFFQGFCRYLKPQYCVLLDIGTTPAQDGISNLIKSFQHSPLCEDTLVGGVTGLLNVDIQFNSLEGGQAPAEKIEGRFAKITDYLSKCFFSVERAQQYEYIMAHFLDKNQESALGFLHVLPGAWSAYKYDALIKSQQYQPNLLERSYFKMILSPHLEENDYQQANMYLAEDRILSLGIYCQMNSKYILKYAPDAKAFTDPMRNHQNLMSQRRRWINSSFFAFLYVYRNYYFNMMDSAHSIFRKYISLNLSILIGVLSLINGYIFPSLYVYSLYQTFYQLSQQYNLFTNSKFNSILPSITCFLYIIVFLTAVGGSLIGKDWCKYAGKISILFTTFNYFLTALVFMNIIQTLRVDNNILMFQKGQINIIFVLTALNLGCMLIVPLLHLFTHPKQCFMLLKNWLSYISYSGAYTQTMVIHAFCNVDDVSWGTKGNGAKGILKFQMNKIKFISAWLFVNSVFGFIFFYIDIISNWKIQNWTIILIIIGVYGTAVFVLKTILAVIYQIKHILSCLSEKIGKLSNKNEKKYEQNKRFFTIDLYWKMVLKKWETYPSENKLQTSVVLKKKSISSYIF